MATRTVHVREEKNNEAVSFLNFFRLNLNYVYTDVDNRERVRGRDKKQRRRVSLKEQREN